MLEVLARIRHRRIRRQLSPYLDGMLSARENRRLEAHLARCRACRDELAELQATIQALAELPLAETPRSFALTAAPRRVEALRPASRRLEFGLRLATAAAAFVLAIVAVGDLLGVPGGEEEEGTAEVARLQVAPTETGTPPGTLSVPEEVQPSEAAAEDKALTEVPTAPSAAEGLTEGYGAGEPAAGTPSPESPVPAPSAPAEALVPGIAQPTAPAATATRAATPTLAAAPTLAEAPAPAEAPAATPEVASPAAPEMPAATATPAPVGAQIAPSEPKEQPPPEAEEQALAEAEREALAPEEGGPSRETVMRWLEIGLATGLALLFVSWILARRRGRA